MATCEACSSRILFGGVTERNLKFCNQTCVMDFKIKLAEGAVPRADLEKQVGDAFHGDCPQCRQGGPLDLFSYSKVTSYVIVYTVTEYQILSCRACARKSRFKAALHTLFLGIWSPKGLLISVFYAPYTFIAGALTALPTAPSKKFVRAIKANVGERLLASVPLPPRTAQRS